MCDVKKCNCKQSHVNRKWAWMKTSSSNQPSLIRENTKTKFVANADPIFTPMLTAKPQKKKNEGEVKNGSVENPPEKKEYLVKELMDESFTYEAWKGRHDF